MRVAAFARKCRSDYRRRTLKSAKSQKGEGVIVQGDIGNTLKEMKARRAATEYVG
jgi:hypothetical protein